MRVANMHLRLKSTGARRAWAGNTAPRPHAALAHIRAGILSLALLTLPAAAALGESSAAKDQELLNQGKVLIFDKNWEGARAVFQRLIHEYPQSNVVPQAYYFIARCLQFQGKESDAILAYETFLQRYPNEPVFPSEAKNAVVELSASLMEEGDSNYRDRLVSALSPASPAEVRYFAAIRCSRLKDKSILSTAVPILREIVRKGGERDLVDRARIALLRLDPEALAPERTPSPKANRSSNGSAGRMFHIEIYQGGSKKPKVELNLPMALAEFAVKALDESTKKELRKQGFDIDNFLESFKQLGPTKILTLRDGDNVVKIWID
jgi:tetratricopeptide (TPR) repeat protein